MELLFFIGVIGTIYSYALYPFLLSMFSKRRDVNPPDGEFFPNIALIVTVHNEEKRIEEKIQNSLAINYPKDKIITVIASDCSTDRTNEIVKTYANQGVLLVEVDQHNGKEYAQLCAIEKSQSDIIVFSDVATQIPSDAIQILARYFEAPEIGAVSSEDRFISDDGKIAGEGAYVKYEMWLRKLESQRAGLVGLSGSFFAARREICDTWDTQSPSDFNTAQQCAIKGKIAVSSPEVLGFYKDLSDPKKEYNRKVRTVLRGITALFRHLDTLNIFKHGLFAFQVWSHKVMRWLVPWFMLITAITSLVIYDQHWFYQLAVFGQLFLYGVATLAWKIEPIRQVSIAKLVFFFVQVNIAIGHAWFKYLTGTRMTVWAPSQR